MNVPLPNVCVPVRVPVPQVCAHENVPMSVRAGCAGRKAPLCRCVLAVRGERLLCRFLCPGVLSVGGAGEHGHGQRVPAYGLRQPCAPVPKQQLPGAPRESRLSLCLWLQERLSARRTEVAAWLRDGLVRLGPTFIKVGQQFSTRIDILPPEFVRELEKLQDDVPPFDTPTARSIIHRTLGRPVEELFSSFEDKPLAAASLGQVSTAHWAATPSWPQPTCRHACTPTYARCHTHAHIHMCVFK